MNYIKDQQNYTNKMTRTQVIWTKEEDEILLNSINLDGRKNWKYIATLLKSKTPIQCFYRFRKINPEITKSKWTADEDELLLNLHKTYGNNWSKIAKLMRTRGPKQIRDRFINNLDPKIKRGNFSISEDLKILKLKSMYGNRWSLISKHFSDRSPDIIKSRYYSSVKNKKELLFFLDSLDNINSSNCTSQNSINNKDFNLEDNLISQCQISVKGFQSTSYEDKNINFRENNIFSQQTNFLSISEVSSEINYQSKFDNSVSEVYDLDNSNVNMN